MSDEGPESHDPVWVLLDRARPVEVRPEFSRDVLEAVRHEEDRNSQRWVWLRALWTPAARPAWLAAAAALVVSGWWATHRPAESGLAATATPTAVGDTLAQELADQIASELTMLDEVDDLLAPESAQDLGEADIERLLF